MLETQNYKDKIVSNCRKEKETIYYGTGTKSDRPIELLSDFTSIIIKEFFENKCSKMFKNVLTYIILIVILLSAVFNAFRNAYSSHISFFEKKPIESIENVTSKVSKNRVLNTLFKYTGLDTGYGFFSPNVASDFIIIHEVYQNGNKNNILSDSKLKSKEGSLRFSNINAIFMDYLDVLQKKDKGDIVLSPTEDLNMKYLQTVLKRMSDERMKIENADSVVTKVYLYNFPALEKFPDTKPKIIEIEKAYSRKNK